MKKLTILLTLIIILFSCTQKEKISDNIIDLTLITEPDALNISELGSEITYFPLETNESCLISDIDKLIYEGGSYFLRSISQNNELSGNSLAPPPPMMPRRSLFRFSKNGEFICQISQKGGGPSEYIDIQDFSYNKSNNTIDIFFYNEIKEFSLDGVWKKNITLDYNDIYSLAYANNQFFGFINNASGQTEYSFVLFDANGQIINKYKNKYKFSSSRNGIYYSSACVFYGYDGILHYKEMYSDTIFSFNNGTFIPKYILNQGEAKYSIDLREKFNSVDFTQIIFQKKIFESRNYLFYQYRLNDRDNCFIQNKSNGTQYLIDNRTGLVNDFDNGPNFKIQNTVTVDGVEYLISWIEAFELKAHVDSETFKNSTSKYPEKKKQLEQLANSLNENDNPVLMLVKLKE